MTPGQPQEGGVRSDAGTATWTIRALSAAAVIVFGLAATGSLIPGDAGEVLDGAAVAFVVAAPLARVAGLGIDFAREHDWRFALAALALLGVIAAGAALSA